MIKKNIVLGMVAHVDSGKTTLSESLLYQNGKIRKMGRVDHGDSFLDTDSMERQRGITIFSKQALLENGGVRMTLLDTPGHVDFTAEMERALSVLDAAVLVISAQDGVKGHTKTVWKLLERYRIPCVLFVNKMDTAVRNPKEILQELKKELSENIMNFTEKKKNSEAFYEQIAVGNENLLNEYLETGTVSKKEISDAVMAREIYPCFFGSALKMLGVGELLDFLMESVQPAEYGSEFGAKVFKITRDEQGKRITHIKITGGCLKPRQLVTGVDEQGKPWEEKVDQIRIYSGDKYENVSEAAGGVICAVTGLTKSRPFSGLGTEAANRVPVFEPVLQYQIVLPDGGNVLAVLPEFKQLEEEEPELQIEWDEKLKELRARLMGEVQLEIVKQQMEERFHIRFQWKEGKILYKETVADTVYGIGHFEPLRHYAEVHLRVEPGEPGTGIQAASECSEELLAKNWQRLIMTHLEEREYRGILTGAPLTDVKITVIGGRAHVKHTQGGDFRQATCRAVRQALMQSHSVLLEPFYEFDLTVPTEMVGRAMTDLDRMSAEFALKENRVQDNMTVLQGILPVSTVGDYSIQVISYTNGRGNFSCRLKGFYPCHNTEEVVEKTGYRPEEDFRQTADSVFCFHGAGEIVPWDRVKEYAHVELHEGKPVVEAGTYYDGMPAILDRPVREKEQTLGTEEIDRLLSQASSANRNRKEQALPGYLKKQPKQKKTDCQEREWSYSPVKKLKKYLLIDGYNVIFAWEELKALAEKNMDGARGKLMDILCDYRSMKDYEIILVFDAYRVAGHPTEYADYQNIHLVYTKEAETADYYIERFSHENSRKYDITVVTSDGLEQIIIRGQGCRLLSSREFEKEVADVKREFQRMYMEKQPDNREKTCVSDLLTEEDKKNLSLL